MLRPTLITAPTDTPVSLAEAKARLRVESANTDEDDLITALVDSATAYLDGYTGILGRCLMPQTWRTFYESFLECDDDPPVSLPTKVGPTLRLPFPGVTAAVVKYYDAANAQQTVDSSQYQILVDDLGSFVAFPYTYVPPNTYFRADAVSVDLTAGYADAASVPAPLKQAILLLVGDWYQSRETAQAGRIAALPYAVEALVEPFRCVGA